MLNAGMGSTFRHFKSIQLSTFHRDSFWWWAPKKIPKSMQPGDLRSSYVWRTSLCAGKPKVWVPTGVLADPYPIDPMAPRSGSLEFYGDILTGWWFGTFFMFHNIWDNPSHWLIFFRGVESTNQLLIRVYLLNMNASEFSMVSRRFSLAKTSVLKIGCWLIVALKIGI